MNDHHLILGTLTDIITGKTIDDTHDERYRQKIAMILLHQKHYAKEDIRSGYRLQVTLPNKQATLPVDFIISIDNLEAMLIKYGPGSLITRHRPAIAAARLVAPHPVPVVVVTNGEDADILCGTTGKQIGSGLDAIPDKPSLCALLSKSDRTPITPHQLERESRILYAFEVDGSCPCDSSICRIPNESTKPI